ncbi:translation initiation factor IF-2-like [Cervus canadensis]|uniref:translation initiation factor IF-2-like n=1 Tax=Cervus canadensis TaxID=1574408 RepID=UPI001C9E79CA|nr:translation initiation factor IF-2-like [Cervus canadensis]
MEEVPPPHKGTIRASSAVGKLDRKKRRSSSQRRSHASSPFPRPPPRLRRPRAARLGAAGPGLRRGRRWRGTARVRPPAPQVPRGPAPRPSPGRLSVARRTETQDRQPRKGRVGEPRPHRSGRARDDTLARVRLAAPGLPARPCPAPGAREAGATAASLQDSLRQTLAGRPAAGRPRRTFQRPAAGRGPRVNEGAQPGQGSARLAPRLPRADPFLPTSPSPAERRTRRPSSPRRGSESREEGVPGIRGWARSPARWPRALLAGLRGRVDLRKGSGGSPGAESRRMDESLRPGRDLSFRLPAPRRRLAPGSRLLLVLRRHLRGAPGWGVALRRPGAGSALSGPRDVEGKEERRRRAPAEGAPVPHSGAPAPRPGLPRCAVRCALRRRSERQPASVASPRSTARKRRSGELSDLPRDDQRAVTEQTHLRLLAFSSARVRSCRDRLALTG